MQGYWRDEAATARALRQGRYSWEKVLHTGDLFRGDEDGFLYFVGRKDWIPTRSPYTRAARSRCPPMVMGVRMPRTVPA
jgi:long-subunit acyl-CoA synthetase (AMP-forming)